MFGKLVTLAGLAVLSVLGVVSLTGAAQAIDIVFVVDESGSMCTSPSPSKVDIEVDGFKAAIDNVVVPFINAGGGPVRIGVVRFSSTADTAIELTDVGTPTGVAAVKAALDEIKANPVCGMTNITDALQESNTVLDEGAQRKVINLASNGNPTVGENPVTNGTCDNLKTAGREIWTIAIGSSANVELLESCSGPGIDRAFNAATIGEFEDIEAEKLGAILQLGSITVVSEVLGEAPDSDWQYGGDLGSFTLLASGEQQSFSNLTPGNYTITESLKPGYTVSVSCDTGESGVASISVNLQAGENATCIFINTLQENQLPTADPQSVGTDEDTPLDITLTGGDPDNDPLTFIIIREPTNGSLSPVTLLDATSAQVTYIPNLDYNGTDSFTFQVDDGRGGIDIAEVTININPVNDPPLARDVTLEASCADFPMTFTLSASDVDGGSLTCSTVDAPRNGALDINDCIATYTPAAGFPGSDSFTYKANDGTLNSNVATVSLTTLTTLGALFFDDMESGAAGWNPSRGSQWHLADDTSCSSPGYSSPSHAWYFGDEASCTYSGRARGNLWSPAISIPQCADRIAISFNYLLDLDRKDRVGFYHKRYEVTACFYRSNGYYLECRTIWNLGQASYGKWISSGDLEVSVPSRAAILKLRFSAMGKLWHNPPRGAGWLVDDVKTTATTTYSQPAGGASAEINATLPLQLTSLVNIPNPVSEITRFIAQGQGIKHMKVKVFDMSGRAVFESDWVNNDFLWEARDNEGNFLANGVYLYLITVKGSDGGAIRGRVKKLVILR